MMELKGDLFTFFALQDVKTPKNPLAAPSSVTGASGTLQNN